MLLSCHFSISAKYKYDLASFPGPSLPPWPGNEAKVRFFFGRFQRDLSRGARAVRGGAERILWVEQPWNVHLRKLDREIFEDGPSAKIGFLENFRPYGTF